MRFRATVFLGGKTATGIVVPEEVLAGLGGGKRPKVTVTINGYSYRSTIAPYGGQLLLPLSAENRTGAGVAAGDDVDVDVELDTAPREVAVPADLAQALDTDPVAAAFFAGLSFTNQRVYVQWIEDAKKPETRTARVTKAVEQLHEGRIR
jgi:hypothetical protein